MNEMIFSFNVVMPVFLIVFLGIILKRSQVIDDHFVTVSSSLVFKVTIPALIFINIAGADFFTAFNGPLIILSILSVLFSFIIIYYLSFPIKDSRTRGAFIQASFRSNFAILGLAILFNLFGKNVMPTASVVLGFLMPLFNILSVIALLKFKVGDAGKNDVKFWREIFRNPLILAAIVSLPFSWFSWPIPIFMEKSIDYLASLTMPLALIGIGGSMSFRGLQRNFLIIFISSILKIIILPIVVTSLAVFLGFRGHELGIVFVFFGTPTAIVSFIMAKAMDSDSLLTANIILLSTLGSIFTMGAGIYILKYLQLI